MTRNDQGEGIFAPGALEVFPSQDTEDIERRRNWFDEQFREHGEGEYFIPTGSLDTERMAKEVRAAYAHGLFISTVILSFSIIEHILTQALIGEGKVHSWSDEKVTKPHINDLLEDSKEQGIIDEKLALEIEHKLKNELRNSYVHYRHFNHPQSLFGEEIRESGLEGYDPNEFRKGHAQTAVILMMKVSGSEQAHFQRRFEEKEERSE